MFECLFEQELQKIMFPTHHIGVTDKVDYISMLQLAWFRFSWNHLSPAGGQFERIPHPPRSKNRSCQKIKHPITSHLVWTLNHL